MRDLSDIEDDLGWSFFGYINCRIGGTKLSLSLDATLVSSPLAELRFEVTLRNDMALEEVPLRIDTVLLEVPLSSAK